MKYLFLSFSMLCFGICLGQYDTAAFPIPMDHGIVFYHQSYSVNSSKQADELYGRALHWFGTPSSQFKKTLINQDQKSGTLSGMVAYKVLIPGTTNYFWIRAKAEIHVIEGSYAMQVYDFYEKPIEKGITNDYSKIEYRWWDFRKGKPWSSEDEALFSGLDQGTKGLMSTLQTAMPN
ncbi:MAG: hypothetical protein ACHQEM_08220 [Chitinophagales bacterium]